MPLRKRKPGLIVEKTEQRLKGMLIIDKNYNAVIDYGSMQSPLSSIDVKQQIVACIEHNNKYNDALIIADVQSALLKEAESNLADMYSRILSGCVSKFGNDAPELSILGGTRKSERKRTIKYKE
jgi:hypothetical protein